MCSEGYSTWSVRLSICYHVFCHHEVPRMRSSPRVCTLVLLIIQMNHTVCPPCFSSLPSLLPSPSLSLPPSLPSLLSLSLQLDDNNIPKVLSTCVEYLEKKGELQTTTLVAFANQHYRSTK